MGIINHIRLSKSDKKAGIEKDPIKQLFSMSYTQNIKMPKK